MSRFVYRIGVGTEGGPRSAVWRIWNDGRKSDVYVGGRSISGVLKVSLHESGACHLGFTSQHAAKLGINPKQRHWDEWARPDVSSGVTLPLRLLIPARSLRNDLPEDGTPGKPLIWIQPVPDRPAVAIDLLFVTRELDPGDWPGRQGPGTTPLARHRLPNGQDFWIVGYPTDLNEESLADARRKTRATMTDFDPRSVPSLSTLRIFYFAKSDSSGIRIISDVAADEVFDMEEE